MSEQQTENRERAPFGCRTMTKKAPARSAGANRRGCKPSSVPLRVPIIKLSAQPADRATGPRAARATPLRLFGFAPEGVCLDTPAHARRRWALAPPFHPCRPEGRRSVSVALSVARVCPAPAGHYSRPSRSVEPGLSSRGRPRAIGRPDDKGGNQIRMRPQAGQTTIGAFAGSLSACVTACFTEGGWTRLQPEQTPSARLNSARQGQRVRLRRS